MKVIKREIIIPEMSKQGYLDMQDGACSDEADCRGIACRQCIYYKDNIDHFINYFGLLDAAGTITVKETIKEEELH